MVEMVWATTERWEDDNDWPWENWKVYLTMVIDNHTWADGPIWHRYRGRAR